MTQFLGFEPLENPASARKYILEPLSRKEPQEGLENLRLALQVISLRRTKLSCSTRQRIEEVEQVFLNERERCRYNTIRADAKKSSLSVTGRSQGDILLRAISTLRQVCSHGGPVNDTLPEIRPARDHNICYKCGELIVMENHSVQSFHGTCGHSLCYECTLDQNCAEGSLLDSTRSTCWLCQAPAFSVPEDVRQWSGNQQSDILMDWQPTTALTLTSRSSKIDKAVQNLQKLEQMSPVDTTDPIKR